MRKYESTFILRPDVEESAAEELIERIKGIIDGNDGKVEETDVWGVKKLAYEINNHNTGFYTVVQFNGTSETVDELQRNFRLLDDVIRYIIVRMDD